MSILSGHYIHRQFWGWSKWLRQLHGLERRDLQFSYRFQREWSLWAGTTRYENTHLQEWQWYCISGEPYDICRVMADEMPSAWWRKRDLRRSEGWWNEAAFEWRKVRGTCPLRNQTLSLCWWVVKEERRSIYEELLSLNFSKGALAIS